LPSGPKSRAVALVSGGLDSVVSLAAGLRETDVRLVLFCNYGQGAVTREREAVLAAVNYYQVPFREVDLVWLGRLAPDGLCPNPTEERDGRTPPLDSLTDVWVPNRNGVFLSVAAAFAESYGCDRVIAGFNREEAAEFPDNRPEFVAKINESFKFSTLTGVEVKSYTQDLTKREILLLGQKLGAPLSIIWSCYTGGETMCGRCSSCRKLRQALDSLTDDKRPRLELGDNGAADI
jgi:7-cyano-7-deazaguanine synthase